MPDATPLLDDAGCKRAGKRGRQAHSRGPVRRVSVASRVLRPRPGSWWARRAWPGEFLGMPRLAVDGEQPVGQLLRHSKTLGAQRRKWDRYVDRAGRGRW